jgi:hypothetical protein
MLTNNDQEMQRLGMTGMAAANKKFDSFFVSRFFQRQAHHYVDLFYVAYAETERKGKDRSCTKGCSDTSK